MQTRTAKSEYARALDLLSRYLALRDHSRAELRTKLGRRFEPELVEQILAEADSRGLLAPEEEIAQRAALALQRRLKSRRYIEEHLRKRKLPTPAFDDEVELENARALLEKKFGSVQQLSYDERGKAYRYLKYRGFNDRVIRMVIHAK